MLTSSLQTAPLFLLHSTSPLLFNLMVWSWSAKPSDISAVSESLCSQISCITHFSNTNVSLTIQFKSQWKPVMFKLWKLAPFPWFFSFQNTRLVNTLPFNFIAKIIITTTTNFYSTFSGVPQTKSFAAHFCLRSCWISVLTSTFWDCSSASAHSEFHDLRTR